MFKKRQATYFGFTMRTIFAVSIVTFCCLAVLEYLLPGFVTNWLNPLWILILAILSGIMATTYD